MTGYVAPSSNPVYSWEDKEFQLPETWVVSCFSTSGKDKNNPEELARFSNLCQMWEYFMKAPKPSDLRDTQHYQVFVEGYEPKRENYKEGGIFAIWKTHIGDDLNSFFNCALSILVSDQLADRPDMARGPEPRPQLGGPRNQANDRYVIGLRFLLARKSKDKRIPPCCEFWVRTKLSHAPDGLLTSLAQRIHGAFLDNGSIGLGPTPPADVIRFYTHTDLRKEMPVLQFPFRTALALSPTVSTPQDAAARAQELADASAPPGVNTRRPPLRE